MIAAIWPHEEPPPLKIVERENHTAHLSPAVAALPLDPYAKLAMQAACDAWHVPQDQIRTPSRRQPGATARQVASWILHHDLGWSQSEVARQTGCDHTNVIHACRQVDNHNEVEPDFARRLAKARTQFQVAIQ